MATPRHLIREAALRLDEAGVPSAHRDAELLLSHVLGVGTGGLLLVDEVTEAQRSALDLLVQRRAAREPLQHLTGVAGFRYLELAVGPGVFVPRPETELLAGWAVDAAEQVHRQGLTPIVVDLCTGSGAIAASVAHEVPGAQVYAVELDPQAHAWAERNLAGSGVDLRLGDLAEAFDELTGQVHVVVSNPPYIPLEAWASVAPEARDHDPAMALFSGVDGLDAIRVIARRAALLLSSGGVVGVEHADEQGDAVPGVFAATGDWARIRDHRDLAGRPRFTTARLAR
ncbi:peptide chain release factor N(5)-glutamine methyltransferase [Nocardioides limicola]|uniref:peptide chain release factor N(5)-glutamine methyltransferase n=1 Tax=Nocardioides limicola TaxID=2803368 RepID=UPI00193B334A|nr:peptide chain release factor N(5)-glutamine methyltransferase [Nocardioides sp. DJM-14]